MSHTEDAEERGRRTVLGLPELSNVYSTHHDDFSCATPQDAAVEAANPGRQRQNSSEGISSPYGQALGHQHGKGNQVPTVWSNKQRQGRDHWDSNGTVGGRTELDLVQDEIDETKRLLQEAIWK